MATYDRRVDGDDLSDLGAPNCPACLEPMDAVVGTWWCKSCGQSVSVGTSRNNAVTVQPAPGPMFVR
jgi:ribosomal protein L37AE/L43A